MKIEKDINLYVAPQMSVIELLLEQTILQTSGDPEITNPDMGWGE